jgi:hypothetical protein
LVLWKRSRKEPSFENTFVGFAFGGIGFDVGGVLVGIGEA